MSKTLKKVLVFLLALAIVTAAIVALEVLLGGRNGHDGSPGGQTTPGTSSPAATPSGQSAAPTPGAGGWEVETEQTEEGIKYRLKQAGGNLAFSLVVDGGAFRHESANGAEVFRSLEDDDEYLMIRFLKGETAQGAAPGFLDKYIKYNEFEQSGENYIDGTSISGETVSASDGKLRMEAWLVDTDGGVLAVLISYRLSEEDRQLPRLREILSTLSLEGLQSPKGSAGM